ncbi:hypothetical protein [Streptomyces atratus]
MTGFGATVSAVIDALNAVPLRSVANFEGLALIMTASYVAIFATP